MRCSLQEACPTPDLSVIFLLLLGSGKERDQPPGGEGIEGQEQTDSRGEPPGVAEGKNYMEEEEERILLCPVTM